MKGRNGEWENKKSTGRRAQSTGHRAQRKKHRAQSSGHRGRSSEHRAQGAGQKNGTRRAVHGNQEMAEGLNRTDPLLRRACPAQRVGVGSR